MKFSQSKSSHYPRAVLDIGSQNIVCLYGKQELGGVKVMGHVRVASRGIESGSIVNMKLAKESISQALHEVEEMADTKITEVMGNLSFGRPTSRWEMVNYEIGGETITDQHIQERIAKIKSSASRESIIMRAIPLEYVLDGNSVRTPVDMKGGRLRVTYHLISVNRGAYENMIKAVNECGVDFNAFIPTPSAAAWGVLTEEEFKNGITVIDFGAETTSLGIFDKGVLVHTEQIQIGSSLATKTIAQSIMTPLVDAERIKRFHGSAIVDSSVLDRDDPTFELPILDDAYPTKVVSLKKSVLHQVTHFPLKEIVEKLHRRLSDPRFSRYNHHRLVLTGGGSQLEGMTALVSEVFGQPAIRKEVNNLHRPPPELLGADSAVAVGLLNRFVSSSNPPSGSLSYRDIVRDFRIGLPKWRQKKVSHNPSRVNP